MKTETFKTIKIQLSDEDIQAIDTVRQLLYDIQEIMHDEDCEFLLSKNTIYGERHYTRDDLLGLETEIEILPGVQEIF